jgi:hypothetical protein
MESLSATVRPLRRKSEREQAIRRPATIRVIAAREIGHCHDKLKRFPIMARAIPEGSVGLQRAVNVLLPTDSDGDEA